jgi:nitrite reductase/ring-hydroxylating ferredoxin subunit/uncharacterized membrane protein
MRSRASIKGHPIHPMLIPFPIAFLVGAFASNTAGRFAEIEFLWMMGAWLALAGIAMALVAAVPGFIDYFGTVPPDSSGKKRATLHMAVNLGAVVLFVVAWLLRGAVDVEPPLATLGLEFVALGLLTAGGWMGGTLAYRNQIGVDHRYAEAGKWKEESVDARPGQTVDVAGERELQVDQMKLLKVGDRRIVLARTAEGYVAFQDRCPHRGGSLAGGQMMCGTVQCPWHGSQFDVTNGDLRAGPAEEGIAVFQVRVEDGRVKVTV